MLGQILLSICIALFVIFGIFILACCFACCILSSQISREEELEQHYSASTKSGANLRDGDS